MNIESIKKQTENYYVSEGKEDHFKDRIEKFKQDIVSDFSKFKNSHPDKTFDDFKSKAIEEIRSGFAENYPLLSAGIFLKALELITPSELI